MRNRTELVANTGSDYDENEAEFEADDGSDDWKPDPEASIASTPIKLRSEKRYMRLCQCKWRREISFVCKQKIFTIYFF